MLFTSLILTHLGYYVEYVAELFGFWTIPDCEL